MASGKLHRETSGGWWLVTNHNDSGSYRHITTARGFAETVNWGLKDPEISSDLVRPDALGDDWAMAYPQSATCLTAEQAREALLDLLDKLPLPQVYVPTSYHWLLMYECLRFQIECINDDPLPSLLASLKACVNEWDDSYLCLSPGSQGQVGLTINFDAFIDVYFWDTDFLLDPATFYQLEAPDKKSLGYRADLFSVLSGLSPHPTELVLKRIDQF